MSVCKIIVMGSSANAHGPVQMTVRCAKTKNHIGSSTNTYCPIFPLDASGVYKNHIDTYLVRFMIIDRSLVANRYWQLIAQCFIAKS